LTKTAEPQAAIKKKSVRAYRKPYTSLCRYRQMILQKGTPAHIIPAPSNLSADGTDPPSIIPRREYPIYDLSDFSDDFWAVVLSVLDFLGLVSDEDVDLFA